VLRCAALTLTLVAGLLAAPACSRDEPAGPTAPGSRGADATTPGGTAPPATTSGSTPPGTAGDAGGTGSTGADGGTGADGTTGAADRTGADGGTSEDGGAASGDGGAGGGLTVADACQDATPLLLADIGTGVRTEGVRLVDGVVVRTLPAGPDAPTTWFVAAAVEGPGVEPGAVGVWVTTDPSGEAGLAYAVDATARAVTDWGDAGSVDPAWADGSGAVAAVRACQRGG
jgi:hypothetical protein